MRRNSSLRLDIKTPSLFRCPISLEVMQSPVSLCTGVTYDRSSIQHWLDSGNTTCPATMLPLPSTDLVPNLTLRRLINLWSSSLLVPASSSSSPNGNNSQIYVSADLLEQLGSNPDPLPILNKLVNFFADVDIDECVKNGIVCDGTCSRVIVSVMNNCNNNAEVTETAIRLLSVILTAEFIKKSNKDITISALLSESEQSVSSIISVLNTKNTTPGSRTAAARVLDVILSASLLSIGDKEKLIVPAVVRLVRYGTMEDVDAGLSCMTSLMSVSKVMLTTMIQAGAVAAIVGILSIDPPPVVAAMERAMAFLEAVANCPEGQAAIGQKAEECVEAVLRRMMKVGRGGREAAVGTLWGICYGAVGSGERTRAREAVARASGGMAMILVVMQLGDCSPRVTKMAGDLLRLFRAHGKSRLDGNAGYDTRTIHIMPF